MAADPRDVRSLLDEGNVRVLGRWAASVLGSLGPNVLRELGRFTQLAGSGAMITIRRNRDGFTAQVTGPIVGGTTEPLTAMAIWAMTREIEGNGAI